MPRRKELVVSAPGVSSIEGVRMSVGLTNYFNTATTDLNNLVQIRKEVGSTVTGLALDHVINSLSDRLDVIGQMAKSMASNFHVKRKYKKRRKARASKTIAS